MVEQSNNPTNIAQQQEPTQQSFSCAMTPQATLSFGSASSTGFGQQQQQQPGAFGQPPTSFGAQQGAFEPSFVTFGTFSSAKRTAFRNGGFGGATPQSVALLPPYSAHRDGATTHQAITALPAYSNLSFEELRVLQS